MSFFEQILVQFHALYQHGEDGAADTEGAEEEEAALGPNRRLEDPEEVGHEEAEGPAAVFQRFSDSVLR